MSGHAVGVPETNGASGAAPLREVAPGAYKDAGAGPSQESAALADGFPRGSAAEDEDGEDAADSDDEPEDEEADADADDRAAEEDEEDAEADESDAEAAEDADAEDGAEDEEEDLDTDGSAADEDEEDAEADEHDEDEDDEDDADADEQATQFFKIKQDMAARTGSLYHEVTGDCRLTDGGEDGRFFGNVESCEQQCDNQPGCRAFDKCDRCGNMCYWFSGDGPWGTPGQLDGHCYLKPATQENREHVVRSQDVLRIPMHDDKVRSDQAIDNVDGIENWQQAKVSSIKVSTWRGDYCGYADANVSSWY